MSGENLYICTDHQYESDSVPCPACAAAWPPPKPRFDVFDSLRQSIIKELEQRDDKGYLNHGRRLLTNEGRFDPLREAFEEQLDALVYLWMAMMEREGKP